MADDITIRLVAQDDASATFDSVAAKAGGLSSVIQTGLGVAFGNVLTNAVGMAAGAFTGLVQSVGDWITDAMATEKLDVQLARAIKNAGDAAAVTAEEAAALAEEYKFLAGGSDEVVKGAETVLLRFRSIGKDAFPGVLKQTLDLAAAMGIDAQSAALTLGKALESPGEGLLRLRAAGVVFTDEEEKQIKAMTDVGNVAGAQQMILDKLAATTGGAAAANAGTLSGKLEIMRNRLDDAGKSIGAAVLPGLTKLFDEVIEPALPMIEKLATDVASAIGVAVTWVIDNFPKIRTTAEEVFGAIQTAVANLRDTFAPVFAIIGDVVERVFGSIQGSAGSLGDTFGSVFSAIKVIVELWWTYIQIVFNAIRPIQEDAWKTLGEWFGKVKTIIENIWEIVKIVFTAVAKFISENQDAIGAALKAAWDVISNVLGVAWDAIKTIIGSAISIIDGIIKTALAVLRGDWSGAWDAIKTTFEAVWNGLANFLVGVWNRIKGIVLDGINAVIGFINSSFIGPINQAILSINAALGTQFGTIALLQQIAGSNGLLPGTTIVYNYSPTYGSAPSTPRADFVMMQAMAGGA